MPHSHRQHDSCLLRKQRIQRHQGQAERRDERNQKAKNCTQLETAVDHYDDIYDEWELLEDKDVFSDEESEELDLIALEIEDLFDTQDEKLGCDE